MGTLVERRIQNPAWTFTINFKIKAASFDWLIVPHLGFALLQDLLVDLEQPGSEVVHRDGAEKRRTSVKFKKLCQLWLQSTGLTAALPFERLPQEVGVLADPVHQSVVVCLHFQRLMEDGLGHRRREECEGSVCHQLGDGRDGEKK